VAHQRLLTQPDRISGVQLPDPATAAGRAGLAALIAEPARAVVAVDFDGTLAPIVERPEDARPAAGAVDALRALADRVGVCAVVSGRAAADAVALGGLADVRHLQVHGHYGLERWSDGVLETPEPSMAVDTARRRLADLLAGAPAGVHVEDKHHSLVVHTRPAADPAAALAALTPGLEGLAAELGLEAVPGRMVLELRPPGIDKGTALRRLAAEREAASVLYLGDDLGDLPAFDVVEELRAAGAAGLTVASVDPALEDAPQQLADRADLVLAGPTEVVAFLTTLAAAIGQT
jgi:trehalose 6-phosphate phosphatase